MTAVGGFISCFDFVPAVSVVAAEGVTEGATTPARCGAEGALATEEGGTVAAGAGGALAAEADAAVETLAAEVTVVGTVVAEVEVCSELSVAVVPVCVDSVVTSMLVPVAEVPEVASDDDGFCSLDGLRPLPLERVTGMMSADLLYR